MATSWDGMPSSLRIPPRYLPGIRAIVRLTDEGAAQLHVVLQEVPRHLTSERLARQIAAAAPELADDAAEVTEAVLSLVALLPEEAPATARLARDVSESPDLELDAEARAILAERLSGLLSIDALQVSARALDVITEYERVFHDARILTDVRPVFRSDPSQGPAAAAVVATLKVDFHEADRSLSSAYFAMDHSDLLLLRDVIDRAIAKTESLKRLIERLDIPYWEYVEPADASDT